MWDRNQGAIREARNRLTLRRAAAELEGLMQLDLGEGPRPVAAAPQPRRAQP